MTRPFVLLCALAALVAAGACGAQTPVPSQAAAPDPTPALAVSTPGSMATPLPTAVVVVRSPAPSGASPVVPLVTPDEMAANAAAYIQRSIGMRQGEPEVLLSRPTTPAELSLRNLPRDATPAPFTIPDWCRGGSGPNSPVAAAAAPWSCDPNTPLFLVILKGDFDWDIVTGRELPDGSIDWSVVPVVNIGLIFDLSRGTTAPVSIESSCGGAVFKRWLNDPSLPDEEPRGKFGMPCA